MKINVIDTGNVPPVTVYREAFGTSLNNSDMNFLNSNFDKVSKKFSSFGESTINTLSNLKNTFLDSAIVNDAKELLSMNSIFLSDDLIQLYDEKTINKAGNRMKRYIMSNPLLYNLYDNYRCSGYGDTWVNYQKDEDPVWRDDYLDVIDGDLKPVNDDVGVLTTVIREFDNPLTLYERFIVEDVWDISAELVASGIDPTDEDFNEL